jgi:CubicO group peptidase (beta-lactamase class C family)
MTETGTTTLPVSTFPTSSPEAQGIPSSAIHAFLDSIEQHVHPLGALHSFMLLRHGNLVAQGWWRPYQPAFPHMLYSLSKSFTSTAIGIAVEEGLLRVDDAVLSFFPDDAPDQPGENLKQMTVQHLLTMNTGHHEDTTTSVWRGKDDNWPRAFLSLPVEHKPGTWFVYNTAATYMLSAIITRLTGEALIDYLRPRLFEPLGIEHPTWDVDPHGRSIGGSGLHITTADIARFGQLYLQKGQWEGRQIVSEAWIAEATRPHSDTSNTQTNPDWSAGYGCQFWRNRNDSYRGDGAFGQFCIILPNQDAVLAITSGRQDMQQVLDTVYETLVSSFGDTALPAIEPTVARLDARLASLSLPLVKGIAQSPLSSKVFGKTYEIAKNDLGIERLKWDTGANGLTVTVTQSGGDHTLVAGRDSWLAGTIDRPGTGTRRIAANGAWTSESTLELRICDTEFETGAIWRTKFSEDAVSVEIDPNVAWGEKSVVTLTGSLDTAT